jgi:hypothetical protein
VGGFSSLAAARQAAAAGGGGQEGGQGGLPGGLAPIATRPSGQGHDPSWPGGLAAAAAARGGGGGGGRGRPSFDRFDLPAVGSSSPWEEDEQLVLRPAAPVFSVEVQAQAQAPAGPEGDEGASGAAAPPGPGPEGAGGGAAAQGGDRGGGGRLSKHAAAIASLQARSAQLAAQAALLKDKQVGGARCAPGEGAQGRVFLCGAACLADLGGRLVQWAGACSA